MLVFPKMVVQRLGGRPNKEEGLVVDIRVQGNMVGQHMVSVVFLGPPVPIEAIDPATYKPGGACTGVGVKGEYMSGLFWKKKTPLSLALIYSFSLSLLLLLSCVLTAA